MKEHVGKELKIVKPKNMLRLLNRNHLRWYTRVVGRRVVSASIHIKLAPQALD